MLVYQILEDENILVIEPMESLSREDIEALTKEVDLHLLRTGILTGVLIYASKLPGWDSFGSMLSHLRFLRNHRHSFKKLAMVSDSILASVMLKLVNPFISIEVKGFAFNKKDKAMAWLGNSD